MRTSRHTQYDGVATHLLEGRDGLPALWHSRDESGRGG